jgi:Na+-driven multidrug efflux pump
MRNIQVGVNWMTKAIMIAGLIVVVPLILASPYVAQLFTSDVAAIERIVNYIQITALPWAFLMASFPFIFAVIGMGDAKGILLMTIWSMYLANLGPLVAVLLWVGDSTQMVAIAEGVSQVLTFFGCWAYFKYSQKKMANKWGIELQKKGDDDSTASIQLRENAA